MDVNKFNEMVQLVIDQLEGGYYHPNMLKTGAVKDSSYASSGETMFGIDRKNFGSPNDTVHGKNFWGLIDKANASKNWKWNYKGGDLAPELKKHAAGMLLPKYEEFSKRYLSPQAKAIVDSDKRLIFHFIYATYNGEGWFKKFAKDINNAVASGITNTDKLTQIALDSRTKEGIKPGSKPNSLIEKSGKKMATFMDSLKEYAKEGTQKTVKVVKENKIATVVITTVVVVVVYVLYKTIKSNNVKTK